MRFFHASAITRNKRNAICAIQNVQGQWETDQKGIRQLFIAHFRSIYVKKASEQVQNLFDPRILNGLNKIPDFMQPYLSEGPTDFEIYQALMSLGPDKAPGSDELNARAIQSN